MISFKHGGIHRDGIPVVVISDDAGVHAPVVVPMADYLADEAGMQAAHPWAYMGPIVPDKISRAQAKVALYNAGLLDTVEALIADAATPITIKIFWADENEFNRESPAIAAMYAALPGNAGKDAASLSAELDGLFVAAAGIVV